MLVKNKEVELDPVVVLMKQQEEIIKIIATQQAAIMQLQDTIKVWLEAELERHGES